MPLTLSAAFPPGRNTSDHVAAAERAPGRVGPDVERELRSFADAVAGAKLP